MPLRTRRSFTREHAARLIRKHRLDDGPLMVTEFIAHDSRLQFGSLNHVRADIFKGKPPCPQWPDDRTYQRLGKTDVKDPNRTIAFRRALSEFDSNPPALRQQPVHPISRPPG
jgi:hypothetical protein